ncbi:MAG: cardiolipin synthase B, partial [Betaproteobacteria bacterium RIFCSPLOWO2_02_FULL_67_19]
LTLLRNGEQYFPALVQAIDAAAQEIFLETYIFADDETGSLVADALARAAARGVAVQLLLDGFGARDIAPRFHAMLSEAGAHVLVFRPNISPWTLRRNRLRRLHRKLACVDGRVAFVGGINIIDDYDTPNQTPPRYDYAVKIEGLLVDHVRAAAARLWSRVAWATLRSRWPGLDRLLGRNPRAPVRSAPCAENQRAALVVRDNVRHRRDIEEAYLDLIAGARKEVLIANSYFFPGRRFRHAIAQAAARGVRVTLLLQGRVEYVLLHYASRALYGPFLDAGIEVHEYHRSFLHAKVAVFDGRQACVGSSNIDPFSLLLAREANVFVDDAVFAAELRASLLEAMQRGAQPVPPRQWKHKPLWLRVRIWFAYAVARLFIAFAGVDRYH